MKAVVDLIPQAFLLLLLFSKAQSIKIIFVCTVWDATAKSTEGILTGNIYQMGDFHECIETQAPFKTQYCLVTITAHFRNGFGNCKRNNNIYPKNNNFTTILERITVSCLNIYEKIRTESLQF